MQVAKSGPILVTARNSLRILQLFSNETPELGVTEISRHLGLAKSTVSRILSTLVEESILDKDPVSGRYRLGPLLLELGLVASELNPVIRHADPVLRWLRDATHESSYLLLLDEYDTVCVASYESSSGAQIRKGIRAPLGNNIGGLTILSFLDPELFALALEHTANRTKPSSQQVAQIHTTVEDIQTMGYACHEEPRSAGLLTIACPIFTPRGAVTAAVAITGPVQGLTRQHHQGQPALIQALSKAAQQISRRLSS